MEEKVLKAIENLGKKLDKFEKQTNKRFDAIDRRFDVVDKKFIGIDKQFTAVDKRFDTLDKRFDLLEAQTKENTDMLKALMSAADINKAEHDKMMVDIAHLQGDVTCLKRDMSSVELLTANNYKDIVKLKAVK